jgi:hypothetical protein
MTNLDQEIADKLRVTILLMGFRAPVTDAFARSPRMPKYRVRMRAAYGTTRVRLELACFVGQALSSGCIPSDWYSHVLDWLDRVPEEKILALWDRPTPFPWPSTQPSPSPDVEVR